MNTTENMVKKDIQQYLNAGFSLDGACSQVKALRLGQWDAIVDRAKEKIIKSNRSPTENPQSLQAAVSN